ncbi:response regulator transcription factor [Streptomyces sp. NPDC046881]|uniref:response regulator transcription factor n=1 Tax=Streptomyces sp. NPDC046881 TaxID=3155374 RepID=UPI0033F5FC1E
MIHLVVADDEDLVRAGLRLLLRAEDDIEIVAEAADGAAALEAVRLHRPDVLLLDLHMPGLDGPGVLRALRQEERPPSVLVLTALDGDEHIFTCLRAGAAGYLLKSARPTELVHGIMAAAAGDAVLSPAVAGRVVARMLRQEAALNGHAPDDRERLLATLTARERAALGLLAAGMSNEQISGELGLSLSTVKTYVSRLTTKLGVSSRLQAGLLAHRLGLLDDPAPSARGG